MVATPRSVISRYRIVVSILLIAAFITAVYLLMGRSPGEPLPAFPYGELRIGIDASYPPFSSADANGTLIGLDIDVGYAIAAHLNVPIRFINMGLDGLYDSLRADQVDILISALTIDDWRTRDVQYTRPYFDAGLVLVSNTETPIESMQEVPGQSIALQFGSAAHTEAHIWARRVNAFAIHPYELPNHALDAIRLGEADAALVEAVSAYLYLGEHPTWQAELHYITQKPYVIAVQFFRGNTFTAIDTALKDLLEDGTIDALIAKWL